MQFLTQLAAVCLLAGCVNAIVMPPDKDDLCSLPAVTGPCRAAFPRWFYNSTSQRCESLTYGGCGGNANRFKTRELCKSACPCDRCTLQRDPGLCKAFIPSYFYNVTSGECERFIYGGCRGNDNRFPSEDDCAAQCVNRPDAVDCSMIDCQELNCAFGEVTPPGSCCPVCGELERLGGLRPGGGRAGRLELSSGPTRPTRLPTMETPPLQLRCSIEGQTYMTCGTACPKTCSKLGPVICTQQCVPGCQCPRGTVLDEDNMRCVRPQFCPRPDQTCDICTLQPETGLCRAYFPSYYWNVVTRQCEQFIYGGCGGNPNRFSDMTSCREQCACTSVYCPKGSRCKVYQPTGETFCEPSCDLDNGGCADNETCSLKYVAGFRAPCPPVVECQSCDIKGQKFTTCGSACPPTCSSPYQICIQSCVPGCHCPWGTVLDEIQNECVWLNQCTCPPTCSHDYCSFRRNRRKPCSRPPPLTMPACPDQCQTTQCNACYFSKNPLEAASKCDGRACTGLGFTRCLRNWASCVEKFNRQENMCSDDCVAAKNFRCYDYPPCENLRR